MKKLCECGAWYLSEGESCPKCGYLLTFDEAGAYLAEQERRRKELNRRAWEKKDDPKDMRERQRRLAEAQKAADKRPVSAVLIGTAENRSALSTVTRAMVGGAFLGIAGALGGAASGTSKPTHATFSVKYASGRVATETVRVDSERFKELSAVLHK